MTFCAMRTGLKAFSMTKNKKEAKTSKLKDFQKITFSG